MKIAAIGEILWDLFPGSERLGGASFNFAAHATKLGHEVAFISAVGHDARGDQAIAQAEALGLAVQEIQRSSAPTGTVSVTLDDGQPSYVLHRPVAYDDVTLTLDHAAELQADWIYYGTLHQIYEKPRMATRALREANSQAACFYDINLRKDCYDKELIEEQLRSADVVKLNIVEADELQEIFWHFKLTEREFAKRLQTEHDLQAVLLTKGADGCSLLRGSEWAEVGAPKIEMADAVGAGDAFAAAALHGLANEWDLRKVGTFANKLGALVASRSQAVPEWSLEELALMK